ncbi:MAG: ABC transporter permease [Planctomycetes bacterium]|nr:ABC transporter permease [Planctomycetota bacterium]
MPPFALVWRNLLRRPLRSVLTVLSLAIAIFLVCGLRSVITTLRAGVENANPRRLDVLSASGLFVELPPNYQEKLNQIPGVEMTTKFQWFGGYFRSMKNFFAQFAVDPETCFAMYPEMKVPPEQLEALKATRTGCIIGDGLALKYGWKIGDAIPLIGALHPQPNDKPWEFLVVGIYHSTNPAIDNRTMYFRWDYFSETLKSGGVEPGVGVYALRAKADADIPQLIADVEDRFKDSDQRIQCATEAEFQRQFQSMFGNIPLFLGWIGGGILVAILVASLNTLLMSMREQTRDVGVMKALGYTDGSGVRAVPLPGDVPVPIRRRTGAVPGLDHAVADRARSRDDVPRLSRARRDLPDGGGDLRRARSPRGPRAGPACAQIARRRSAAGTE